MLYPGPACPDWHPPCCTCCFLLCFTSSEQPTKPLCEMQQSMAHQLSMNTQRVLPHAQGTYAAPPSLPHTLLPTTSRAPLGQAFIMHALIKSRKPVEKQHVHAWPPGCLRLPDGGILQLSLVLLSGDVELNPGPLAWYNYVARLLAYIIGYMLDLSISVDAIVAATGVLAIALMSLCGLVTSHRRYRPQRAKFRIHLSRSTAPCVRYTAYPACLRHCRYKHSMWVTNPFSCTDGTLASRYALHTLAHTGELVLTNRKPPPFIPGAILTQERCLPLVSVHLRGKPHSTAPLYHVPCCSQRQRPANPPPSSPAYTDFKPQVPLLPHVPAADPNRAQDGTPGPEVRPHTAATPTPTVPQHESVTTFHSLTWVCTVSPKETCNAEYTHSMLWQAVK